jgi:hypothetical protein
VSGGNLPPGEFTGAGWGGSITQPCRAEFRVDLARPGALA